MQFVKTHAFAAAGLAAGIINGLFGAGGGLVLIPLLRYLTDLKDQELFTASVSMILPITLVSVVITAAAGQLPMDSALPYLIGGGLGGIAAGIWGTKIPVCWLHRGLGCMILWGGLRYLC